MAYQRWLLLRHGVQLGLLDVRDGVLNRAGEGVHGHGLAVPGGGDGSLGGLHHALALQRGNLDHLAAKLTGQLGEVDLVAVLADDVHHVHGHDHRNAQLGQLRGQVQVALQVGAVDQVQDDVRTLADQVVTGDDLLQRIGRQRINTGKVGHDGVVMLLETALLLLDGDARPVADKLVGAGERVEQRRLAAVRVARQRNSDGGHNEMLLSCQGRPRRPGKRLFLSMS